MAACIQMRYSNSCRGGGYLASGASASFETDSLFLFIFLHHLNIKTNINKRTYCVYARLYRHHLVTPHNFLMPAYLPQPEFSARATGFCAHHLLPFSRWQTETNKMPSWTTPTTLGRVFTTSIHLKFSKAHLY